MTTFKVHVETHITLTGLPQLHATGMDMVITTPRVHSGHLAQQLVVLGIDLVREADGRERTPDHDAKGKLPLGAAETIPLLDLLAQQQPRHEARSLTEANDALETRHAAVLLHDLPDNGIDAVHLVRGRRLHVALASDKPPRHPAVEWRARREHREHAEPRRTLDRRLREHEPELFRQVPDQSPRLDLEHRRVRPSAVQHQDPREQLSCVVVFRLAEVRGRRCP